LPELSKTLRLGYDTLEEILEGLAGADMVRKVEGSGWVMTRDANHIRITELLRLFVLDRDSLPAGKNEDPLRRWLADYAVKLEQDAAITLQELFARQAA
jgi:DNA-binding IscR family transcriptional regulator